MRARILIGLLVFVWSSTATAMATDCTRWRSLDLEVKRSEVGGMISEHLNSNVSKSYTSENKVAIQRCLREFIGHIVEEIDQACSERPGANAEFVDDLFDRYLLSCI